MTSAHANISIFVPHIGCPNMCSFCNQRYITGTSKIPHSNDVIDSVNVAVNSPKFNPKNTEIAFFGGSFTAINRDYMLELLEAAHKFVEKGTVSGIRISTRPDAVDVNILHTLKKYGVTTIELGAQSLNDDVLKSNNRGHTAKDVESASRLIKDNGFKLGLQMMTGLYKDCDEFDVYTAQRIIDLHPDNVRIYPTIVLKNTDLANLYFENKYKPQTLDDAVNLCAKILKMFYDSKINVIRLGLHTIEEQSYVAGPWHPAFSELCYSKLMLENALKMLKTAGKYTLFVNKSSVSKMIGQHKKNIVFLKNLGFECTVKTDDSLDEFQIRAERR